MPLSMRRRAVWVAALVAGLCVLLCCASVATQEPALENGSEPVPETNAPVDQPGQDAPLDSLSPSAQEEADSELRSDHRLEEEENTVDTVTWYLGLLDQAYMGLFRAGFEEFFLQPIQNCLSSTSSNNVCHQPCKHF